MLKNLFQKKPKDKFSLENLKYLYGVLVKEPVITNGNKARVVEVLRSIAELMIWGDQHSPAFFDFFAEKNILSNFVRILSQKCDNKVKVQIIQTLSILVQNLSNEVSIFYLLSNNYINDMIVHRFDFSDEEIVTYYVNFCKSLSFKLNSRTILFFFNEISQDFPLLNETIKFFNHADSMIRIAVRTITLNIFRINDLALRRYILNKSAVPYFSHLVWFLRDETVKFDKLMHSPQATVGRLETGMEHLLDQIYYLQDVLSSGAGLDEMQGGGFKERDHAEEDAAEHAHIYGIEADPSSKVVLASTGKAGGLYFQHLISEILLDQLLGFYVLPLLCGSLVPALSKVPAHSLIAPRLSFFLLTQLLGVFTHTDFVNSVLSVLVCSRLSPLALRLIQEPPRGPVRNSDGTPLTTLLYPQSRETRRANVNPELILLHQGPLESRSSKRIAHTNHSNLHTPKPLRDASLPQSTSFSRGDGSGANTPQPPTTDSPATEPRTVKPQAMADMELQPIAPKPSPNVEAAATAASSAASAEPSSNSSALASTTMSPDTRSPSTSVSTSAVQSSAEPTISADQSAATTDPSPAASSSALSISTSADSSAAPKSILSPPPAGGWECRCTFVNKPTFLVCSVCGSIRPRSPEWDQAEAAVAAADAAAATGGLVPVVAALPVAVAPSTPAQLASVSVVSTPITNASLASAYLTPGATTLPSTPASSAGIGAGVRSPVASVPSSSATPSGTPLSREIPVDENSRARSKLPEVGPLYSPIDYFGFVKMSATAAAGEALMAASSPLDSSPVAAAVNAVAAAASASPAVSASPPVSASPAAALSSTTLFPVVAVQGTRVDNRRLVEEAESNEYATALLRYLAAAQAECAPAPAVVTPQELEPSTPLSPLHVPSSPVMLPSDRSAASAPDERDIYGSMSVLYSALRHEQADATLLLSANLAAQSHRKSRQLLQSLLADRVGGGGSQTDLLGLLGSPLDSMATPVVKPSRAQRQAAAANGADDKIAEDGRLASGAIPSSLWDSPNDARAGTAGPASSDLLRFDVHMSEMQSSASGSPPAGGAAKSPSPANLLDFSEAAAASSGVSPDGVLPVAAHQRRASSNAPAHEQMEEHDSLEAQPESPASVSTSSVAASTEPQVPAAHAMPGRTESVGSSDPLLQRAAHTRVLSVTMPSPTKTGGASKSSVNHKGSPSRPLFADSGDSDLSDLSLVTPQRPLAAPSNARTVSSSGVPEYNEDLVSQLLNLATHHPPYRMVTLQTMIELVNQFVVTAEPPAVQQGAAHPSYLLPVHVAQLDALYLRLVSEVRSKLTQPLWNLFLLDMFEEEFPAWTSAGPGWDSAGSMAVKKILANVQNLMPIEEKYNAAVSMDYRVQSNATGAINAALNAAASSVPLVSATGAPIPAAAAPTPAVPSAEIERLRKGVQLLLLVRNLRLKNAVQRDTLFYPAPPGPSASPSPSPPPNNTSCAVQPLQSQLFHVSRLSLRQEILTAHHPDAMLCTICEVGAKKKLHLFFVMDEWETMLVELQQNKPGTAIVQLRNSLRHQEAFLNRNNACLLHVTLRASSRPHAAARRVSFPGDSLYKSVWVMSLLFLDAIQCARAFKHLEARRTQLRKNMLGKLLHELESPALPLCAQVTQSIPAPRVPLDEAALNSMASACTVSAMYPGVEADVHADSTIFGIPNLPIAAAPTPPTTAPPAVHAAAAAAAAAPASAATVASSAIPAAATSAAAASTVPAVVLPVAQPVSSVPASASAVAVAAAPIDLFARSAPSVSAPLAALFDADAPTVFAESPVAPPAAAAAPASADSPSSPLSPSDVAVSEP